MQFIDADGNIIVPKSVRSIIDLKETTLGNKKGAGKQYRYGNLHIREYESHYTVHMDKVNPQQNPIGHLIVDAPEYIAGAAAGAIMGKKIGTTIYKKRKLQGKSDRDATFDAVFGGCVAGAAASRFVYDTINYLGKRSKQGQ